MGKDLTKKESLQKRAEELNIDFEESDTIAQLEEWIAEAEMEEEKEEEKKEKAKPQKEARKKGAKKENKTFYWLKVATYVSDDEKLPAGLYEFNSPVKRLDNSSKKYVEKYQGEIPFIRLVEIAKQMRVNVQAGGDYREAEEILDDLIIKK